MYKSINIDAAVEHIKNIVDKNRCSVCDKTNGTRMRYVCGHSSCEDCVVAATDCYICLTPPQSDSREPEADKSFTIRAENAVKLKNVFQNEFHIDVYKRQRISEQLKAEKELFPDCIQAPAKYFGKRKSFINTKNNKENKLSQIPGEEISSLWDDNMDQSSDNVEKWLTKYVRKPLADLNPNGKKLRKSSAKKQNNIMDTENKPVHDTTRKRSHFKTALSVVKNQSLFEKHLTPVKKKEYNKKARIENNFGSKSDNSKCFGTGITNAKAKDNEKDESRIDMDDEAVIIIDDSQSIRVDKDYNALLAVQEAENNIQYDSALIISSKSSGLLPPVDIEKPIEAKLELSSKVPFYLKGYLSQICIDCNGNNDDKSDMMDTTKEVSITVENQSFKAIINVKNVESTNNTVNRMQSVEVQTDFTESVINEENMNYNTHDKDIVKQIFCKSPSQDLFQDDGKICVDNIVSKSMNLKSTNKTQNVIIEESDSDEEIEASVSLEVTAEIHRSCEDIDYGILAEVENVEKHSKRPRRAARGFTPTSTDSSDKENYNPNKKKKAPSQKKKPMKK